MDDDIPLSPDYDNAALMGTVTVRIPDANKVKFGCRVDLYLILVDMTSSDVIASFKGDEFTIPNVPKSTFRAITDALSEHPSNPWFKFTPGGFCRWPTRTTGSCAPYGSATARNAP
jgi:hypothetical protein